MNEAIRKWMKLATVYEQDRLAMIGGTARSYLYKLAGGFRIVTPDIAARLEKASKVLYKESKGRLPILARQDISDVCAECPYSPRCKK